MYRNQRHRVFASLLPLSWLAASCVILVPPSPEPTPGPKPLSPEVARLARALERAPDIDDGQADTLPPARAGDPHAPVNALRSAIAKLDGLRNTAPAQIETPLADAAQALDSAWQTYSAGSPDLAHLGQTTDALTQAVRDLADARQEDISRTQRSRIEALQRELVDIGARMASDLLDAVARAGASTQQLEVIRARIAEGRRALAADDYAVAALHFDAATSFAADTVTFDIALFQQNISSTLSDQTVGHAFSIAFMGRLYEGGESAGLARTAADPPALRQSPGKEMHVASISKTLTAIVILDLLEDQRLTPDEKVAPYLPSDWTLGEGVEDLSFRDFLTHRSGFGQNNVGNLYADLRAGIAMDVPTSPDFDYQNANFGLMRVAAAGLLGLDPVDYAEFEADALTAAAFIIHAQSLYADIGVNIDCQATDDNPTIEYNFPHGDAPGYVEPNHSLACGGFGWFISSNELANVLVSLRLSENLLSDESRALMQQGFLGFMDPANYSGAVGLEGTFGVYYAHGGDWNHSSGEAHACAMAFPIHVQASLLINSERGRAMPYQCQVLQTAFDNAWVLR